jgi:hypothetical protein
MSILSPGFLQSLSSDQVALRHPKYTIYRCFLPDLTGFIALRRVRPDPQHRLIKAVPKNKTSIRNSTPL